MDYRGRERSIGPEGFDPSLQRAARSCNRNKKFWAEGAHVISIARPHTETPPQVDDIAMDVSTVARDPSCPATVCFPLAPHVSVRAAYPPLPLLPIPPLLSSTSSPSFLDLPSAVKSRQIPFAFSVFSSNFSHTLNPIFLLVARVLTRRDSVWGVRQVRFSALTQ